MSIADIFGKFTQRARKVLTFAQEDAQRLHASSIGTNHLLLALLREGEGVAAKALEELGVDLQKSYAAIMTLAAVEQQGKIFTNGVLEIVAEGHGFLRHQQALPGQREVYVTQAQIGQYNLRTGDVVFGLVQPPDATEREHYYGLVRVDAINGVDVEQPVEGAIAASATERIGLSIQSKHSIELAVEEARHFNHKYLGTEHMLLGLIREEEGLAAWILKDLDVPVDKARLKIMQILT